MSAHDPRATLNQIRDAAQRAQSICPAERFAVQRDIPMLLAAVEQMLNEL